MAAQTQSKLVQPPASPPADTVLDALALPVLVLDGEDCLLQVNAAAETFLQSGVGTLIGRPLSTLVPGDSPLLALAGQVRHQGHSMTEHGVQVESPRIGSHQVTVDAAPIAESANFVVLSLRPESVAGRLDQRLAHRGASRSVTGMAAMLAHELKNPLSGIKGAAQLLEDQASESDRELTQLICSETERIVTLIDQMTTFGQDVPLRRAAVNLHEVLDHVRRLAASGFARQLRIIETYDPSLPPAFADRDQLVQALLNLVKNAAEAAPRDGGEIQLSTAYRHGIRVAVPGSEQRLDLPLCIGVRDNGPGIAPELQEQLFDPFITTKANGRGLGLALVGKIVEDHGGLIEVTSEPRRTEFRILLPKAPPTERQR